MNAATERVVVHEADLCSAKQTGRYIYAYCHIHGSDHQRSLHINAENGFGKCHACGVDVFVPELAPDGGASFDARQRTPWRVTAERLLRPARVRPSSEPSPANWQRDELSTLLALDERMRARLADPRPRAYLEGRGIPWDIAAAACVGYIPADAPAKVKGVDIGKWRDRLVFPLASPSGQGYAGRSLWGWQPGMDENAHKALLDSAPDAPGRWWKTYPAGWSGYTELAAADSVVLVEGPVDALALLAAGLYDVVPVVALVGTAGRAEWIPANVRGVVLALDGDEGGSTAARGLAHELTMEGVAVRLCTPPTEDGRGKDWAERWRRAEWEGVWPVFEAVDEL